MKYFIFIIITIIVYYIGFTVDQPYEQSYNKYRKAIENSNQIKAITLGNSHAGSIDWESLGFEKSGMSMHGGFYDIFEMYYVAKNVIPKMDSLRYVFISVPYYFFSFDNGAFDDSYQNSFRQRTYFMVPKFELINNDIRNYFQARIAPIARPDKWKGVIAPPVLNLFEDIIITRPIESNPAPTDYIKRHAKSRTEQNYRQVENMRKGHPNLEQDAYHRFIALLELFKKHNIKAILFRPSYHYLFQTQSNQEMISLNDSLLLEARKRHQFSWFDFTNDTTLSKNDSLFIDSDHYNNKGQKRFSKKLRDSLSHYQIMN